MKQYEYERPTILMSITNPEKYQRMIKIEREIEKNPDYLKMLKVKKMITKKAISIL